MPRSGYNSFRKRLKDIYSNPATWTLYVDESSEELTIEKLGEYYPQLSKSELEYLHEEVLYETGQEIFKRIDSRGCREMVERKDTYHVRHMETLKLKLEA